jgi:hypothetical protein
MPGASPPDVRMPIVFSWDISNLVIISEYLFLQSTANLSNWFGTSKILGLFYSFAIFYVDADYFTFVTARRANSVLFVTLPPFYFLTFALYFHIMAWI